MKQKSSIQKLIDTLTTLADVEERHTKKVVYSECAKIAESLKDLHRKEIESAYAQGQIDIDEAKPRKYSSEYFNETFE